MNESTVLERNASSETVATTQSPRRRVGKALLLAFLVVLGLFLGVVVAIFVGLSTGWIEFGC